MYGVTQEGTSVRSFTGAKYKSGGKTGTAQAVGIKANEKYNAAKMDEYKRDHSLYIAFAPLEAPTVALAVVVENSGFGSEAAAPIARRVFDYLLLGLAPSEEDLAATRIGKSGAPIGTPRNAADLPLPGITSIITNAIADAPKGSAPGLLAAGSAGASVDGVADAVPDTRVSARRIAQIRVAP
jgi:penicillin-binding protein 2